MTDHVALDSVEDSARSPYVGGAEERGDIQRAFILGGHVDEHLSEGSDLHLP